MNIAICDDEQIWTETLKVAVSKWASARKINLHCNSFMSPQELIDFFANSLEIDVLFLDIIFGEKVIDGMNLARRIRKMGNCVPIIFVTCDSFKAADGYLVEAMGFLTKPIDEQRLTLFLDKIIRRKRSQKVIKVMSEGRIINVNQKDIVYAEIIDHTSVYHTKKGKVNFRSTLGDILKTLDAEDFVQIHRSYIIALDKIESIKNTYPYSVNLLNNNKEVNLPVSRKYIRTLLEAYSDDVWEQLI